MSKRVRKGVVKDTEEKKVAQRYRENEGYIRSNVIPTTMVFCIDAPYWERIKTCI